MLPPIRTPSIATLTERPWDLVVIGLGVVGLSAALAAARRGWRVLGVDAGDIGGGGSSASSRRWGGRIYQLDTPGTEAVVAHDLQCREQWSAAFPWAVTWRRVHGLATNAEERAGWAHRVAQYEALSPRTMPTPEWLPQEQAVSAIGGLRGWQGLGAHTYTEATFLEARVLPMLARHAVAAGATLAPDTPVLHVQLREHGWQLATTSALGGSDILTAARVLVATGEITPQFARDLGVPVVTPRWGTHLLIDREHWPLSRAIAWHHPDDGQILTATPWDGRAVLVGTTNMPDNDPPRDLRYLLRGVNSLARREGVRESAVLRLWSGARGILAETADPGSRTMRVVPAAEGFVAAQGGQWTTAPALAARALAALDPATAWDSLVWAPPVAQTTPPLAPAGVGAATWGRWLRLFGPEAPVVAALAASSIGGLRPVGEHGVLAAEVLYVQTHEAATTPERVVARLDAWQDLTLLEGLGAIAAHHGPLLPA